MSTPGPASASSNALTASAAPPSPNWLRLHHHFRIYAVTATSKFIDPWDLIEGDDWDNVAGAHHVHTIKWNRVNKDIVYIFDKDMIDEINTKATGVTVEFTNSKVIKVEGPKQKVDRAFTFLQQLVATETSAATVYVVIGVAGVNAELDSLQQAITDAGKTTQTEKLHFSVCHSNPSFSASEAIALSEGLDEKMKHGNLVDRHQELVQMQQTCILQYRSTATSPRCSARRHHQPNPQAKRYHAGNVGHNEWFNHGNDTPPRNNHQPPVT
ncbi:predicted protein [Lichtheimia corymbifera JMRC:FSU:9682]|uniref:Uncharacterized protein n=1 Tax=Lichtheimia corymbifera JMRC:FSU:9682 TaxID=1263082 RepID=A0A068RKH2_9FUNG|nr:predicted protein [Lichtheimia corymbifera JMRC:FSU:9682]